MTRNQPHNLSLNHPSLSTIEVMVFTSQPIANLVYEAGQSDVCDAVGGELENTDQAKDLKFNITFPGTTPNLDDIELWDNHSW